MDPEPLKGLIRKAAKDDRNHLSMTIEDIDGGVHIKFFDAGSFENAVSS